MKGAPHRGAALAAPAYRKTHGEALTPGEAAQLLARAATGERLAFVPVHTPSGYTLAHLATLSADQRADFARRVAAVADALDLFAAPSLTA